MTVTSFQDAVGKPSDDLTAPVVKAVLAAQLAVLAKAC